MCMCICMCMCDLVLCVSMCVYVCLTSLMWSCVLFLTYHKWLIWFLCDNYVPYMGFCPLVVCLMPLIWSLSPFWHITNASCGPISLSLSLSLSVCVCVCVYTWTWCHVHIRDQYFVYRDIPYIASRRSHGFGNRSSARSPGRRCVLCTW